MPKLTYKDTRLVDLLFYMESGWVLDFSDRTFSAFFCDELDVDIDHPTYETEGRSKAKRLRTFLKMSEPQVCVRALQALWQRRLELIEEGKYPNDLTEMEGKFLELLQRVQNCPLDALHTAPVAVKQSPAGPISQAVEGLIAELAAMVNMQPQPRGYAFEAFLTKLFKAYGLDPRTPFKNVGEQIDGSFQFQGDTYLVEAKWKAEKTGAADLHVLEGKLSLKAAWARGVFISFSGFTSEGLVAFHGPKRVVCIDGRDLWQMLHCRLSLAVLLDRKLRHAAETGECFVSFATLYPELATEVPVASRQGR